MDVTDAAIKTNPKLEATSLVLPDGEAYKDMPTLMKIIDRSLETRLDRKATYVALGGGVIGDMVGFAAAIYQRGVNFVQVRHEQSYDSLANVTHNRPIVQIGQSIYAAPLSSCAV